MRKVEALDTRVNDNIEKTDSVISKLRRLDLKLFHPNTLSTVPKEDNSLDTRLTTLDQKVRYCFRLF